MDTRLLMKERYTGEFPEQLPFRTKAMFVFEEVDGVDVCFFGMHVQEYGSDCQAPNTRYRGRSHDDLCFSSPPIIIIIIIYFFFLLDESTFHTWIVYTFSVLLI